MSIKTVFEARKHNPQFNTSYPLSPCDWIDYRVPAPLSFAQDKALSFYIHIPFCKQLCLFCEYTRMVCTDVQLQTHYLEVLANDIAQFKKGHPGMELQGFDLGGGTPTALSQDNFSRLMDVYDEAVEGITLANDYEPSIEATFNTLTPEKLQRMAHSGIRRLSLGVQSADVGVLSSQHRENVAQEVMAKWMNEAYRAGLEKINIDLMYGLKGQGEATIARDLHAIAQLMPQQITLYELRTNMLAHKDVPAKEQLYHAYRRYYEAFIALGYHAQFGQNTFSLCKTDLGVSSYLRARMVHGASYKGFGLSAQSMSKEGIAYNCGKNSSQLSAFIRQDTYAEADVYQLPQTQLAAKYIAISGYFGSFSLAKVLAVNDSEWKRRVHEALTFCLNEGLVCISGGGERVQITEKGFRYYGAVLSLFYLGT